LQPIDGRILCAVDFSPASNAALRYALDLVRQSMGHVSALHVLEYMEPEDRPEPSPFDPCYQTVAKGLRHRQHYIDHARHQLHAQVARDPTTWYNIEEIVAPHRAYREILQRAAAIGADLIVTGAQGSDGIELMIYGSNTQHVVRAATCPVLTVRAA
jgi:nucleotide-binding universal stress UspA family protein